MISSDVVIGASFLIMFTVLGHIFGLGLGYYDSFHIAVVAQEWLL
jgi:hypothetical protein